MKDFLWQSVFHPIVRGTAEEITKRVPSHDDLGVVRKIYEWVRAKVRYRRDPNGVEYVKAPWVILREIDARGVSAGDCDDMALLVSSLLHTLGIKTRFSVISQARSGEFHHVYLEAFVNGKWLALDPITKSGSIGAAPYATRKSLF